MCKINVLPGKNTNFTAKMQPDVLFFGKESVILHLKKVRKQ